MDRMYPTPCPVTAGMCSDRLCEPEYGCQLENKRGVSSSIQTVFQFFFSNQEKIPFFLKQTPEVLIKDLLSEVRGDIWLIVLFVKGDNYPFAQTPSMQIHVSKSFPK